MFFGIEVGTSQIVFLKQHHIAKTINDLIHTFAKCFMPGLIRIIGTDMLQAGIQVIQLPAKVFLDLGVAQSSILDSFVSQCCVIRRLKVEHVEYSAQ